MKAEWNRPLGIDGQPYLRRWVFPIPFLGWSIRLHRWVGTDDPDAFHDHPTWFCTLVLRGGYTDMSPGPGFDPKGKLVDNMTAVTKDVLRAGAMRFRAAAWDHTVQEVQPSTWTLCLFGKEARRWRFLYYDRQAGWRLRPLNRDKFFAEVGHHAPDGSRVRLRPDGSRIGAA